MYNTSRNPSFDFDRWAELARKNPQLFEITRRNTIEQAISQASPQRQVRLRRLQWQLDQIRSTSGTPLAACIRMQAMLWEKLAGNAGLLACLRGPACLSARHRYSGKILPFRR
jgi:hypothetical protein